MGPPANKKRKASSGPANGGKGGNNKGKKAKTGGAPAAKNNKNGKPSSSSGNNKGKGNGRGKQQQGKNGKKGAAPPPPVTEQADDVEVDEDDMAFFEENAQFSSFLMEMDAKKLSKLGKFQKDKPPGPRPPATANKKPQDASEEPADEAKEEADEPLEKLEARPRRPGWNAAANKMDLASKLPVKFMDGSVRQNKLMAENDQADKAAQAAKDAQAAAELEEQEDEEEQKDGEEEDDEDMDSDVSDMEFEEIHDQELSSTTNTTNKKSSSSSSSAPPSAPPLSAVDLQVQRQRRLQEKKIEIAHLCESILESPEDALKKNKEHPRTFSKIQELHALSYDVDLTVQKLALLSQLSVFLDILPDYRIRLQPKNDENDTKKNGGHPMKKKVQQMHDFEASLLNNYQLFLKKCAQVVKDGLKGKNPLKELSQHAKRELSLAETGVKCLGELLKAKYSFNFHLNLIVALVPMADCAFENIRQVACEAFENVYVCDKSCLATLDIVKQISSYVKQKEHKVKPDIIKTFLKMPLEVTMEQGELSRKRAKNDRKKRRKLQNDGDTIASGLKEAEATVDKREREKTQADILHELVLVYFRILKQATYSSALPAVLEGLSKFAFLINLEIMIDLLKVLKLVLKQDILPLASAFQAVLTGLRALQGPGQELLIDDKEFVDILYTLLRRFSEGEDNSCFIVALQCVEAVFLKRKEIVVDRVAAFIKRLLLTSLSLPPHQSLAVLSLVRSLVHKYNKLQQLLESDIDRVSTGEYRADVDDPDFTNPYSTACWEVSLLQKHYHPKVSSFAIGTSQLGPSLPNEYPKMMLEVYNTDLTAQFVPKVPVPPKNPIFGKMANHQKREKNKKRQRQRKFFVADPIKENLQKATPFFTLCQQVDVATTTTGEEDAELIFRR